MRKSEEMRRLLFFVPDDITFLIQRQHMAQAALDAGFEVHVACLDTGYFDGIRAMGLTPHRIPLVRGSMNPLQDLRACLSLLRVILNVKPHFLHNVSIKPVNYGSLVGRFLAVPRIVCLVNGIGISYIESGAKPRLFQRLAHWLYRVSLSSQRLDVIFQNQHDRDYFISHKLVTLEQTHLIRGSGIDTEKFVSSVPHTQPTVRILFVGRMLRSKGVRELVNAYSSLRARGLDVHLDLVGDADLDNPDSFDFPSEFPNGIEGVVWHGRRNDVKAFYRDCDIFCLPTYYREGLPIVLMEAAASGKPCVTTDMPGCHDVVEDGVTGFVVPPRDEVALANRLAELVQSPDLRERMGTAARERVKTHFSKEIVKRDLTAVYFRSSAPAR